MLFMNQEKKIELRKKLRNIHSPAKMERTEYTLFWDRKTFSKFLSNNSNIASKKNNENVTKNCRHMCVCVCVYM